MKLAYFAFALVCLISIQDAVAFQGVQRRDSNACNKYVDDLVRELKEDKEYFEEPYHIKDKSIVLHKKVIFINYTGEAKIEDGHINGMTSLQRDGDVSISKAKNSARLKVFLGAGVLTASCDAKVELMGHGPRVHVDAKISHISMKVDIKIDPETGANPKLMNLDIEDVKGVDVRVSGLGPLNLIANSFVNVMGTFFKKVVRAGFEKQLEKFLTDKVKKYTVPQECLQEIL